MKSLSLLKTPLAAQLIPSFKQTERRLLSIFMRVLDIVPEFRGHILEIVGYRGGKTCAYRSFMEPTFDLLHAPSLRPDGLLTCKRGAKEWAALIEAKAEKNNIRPEQIEAYTGLAKELDVDSVITISNQFASAKGELPYTLLVSKRKGRNVYHLSWSRLAAEMSMFLETKNDLHHAEEMILQEAIRYFSADKSGVSTFDAMSQSWKNFVESANTVIGFNTTTPGVVDIVRDWQQERRDLCIKLNQQIGGGVESWFPAKHRKDLVARKKHVRETLTANYRLDATYYLKNPKTKLKVVADLRARSQTFVYEFHPPSEKGVRAFSTWLGKLISSQPERSFKVLMNWPGREQDTVFSADDIVNHPEICVTDKKHPPNSLAFITSKHEARRFTSSKRFIEDVESGSKNLIDLVSRMELL